MNEKWNLIIPLYLKPLKERIIEELRELHTKEQDNDFNTNRTWD